MPAPALGEVDAHQQRADQAGPLRHRQRVQIGVVEVGLRHGLRDHGANDLGVGAGGHLGEDPAVWRVQVDLRGDYVG